MTQKLAQKKDMQKDMQKHTPSQAPIPVNDDPTPEEILLREADEALRQERLQNIWDQYGNWIIAGIIGVVALTGLISAYQGWQTTQNKKATAQVMQIASTPDTATDAALSAIPTSQRFIAQLNQIAAAPLEQQRSIAAEMAQSGPDAISRQLGQLLSLRLSQADAQTRLEQLDQLINKKNSYLAGLAALDAATIAGEELQNASKAREYLAIASEKATNTPELRPLIDRLTPLYTSANDQ